MPFELHSQRRTSWNVWLGHGYACKYRFLPNNGICKKPHDPAFSVFLLSVQQFDVPKTNIQARYDTKVFGSYFPELVKIGRQRGVAGLYSGLFPTLIRAFPANAALFLGVETGKKFFDDFLWNEK